LRNLSDGLYAELARRASPTPRIRAHWLNDFNLSLTAFSPATANVLAWTAARAADIETERPGWRRGSARMTQAVSLCAALEIYRRAAGRALGARDRSQESIFAPFDRVSWPAFLKMRGARTQP